MKNKYRNSSRRKTPWDDNSELSPLESFIKGKYLSTYFFKHPKISETEEAALLNTFEISKCRHCNSEKIIKKGLTNTGLQRYYCKCCKTYFNILTNTLFDNHRISITEWIEFSIDIFSYGSINLTSKANKNGYNTSKYWLNKLFIILKDIQKPILLKGMNVYIDETFYPLSQGDKTLKDGKELRGLSKNQICIGIGYDGTNVYAVVEGYGKTNQIKTKEAFMSHIAPKSHLIHDKEKSHKILIKELELTEEAYDSKECKKLEDKDNPLNPINRQCDLLKKFLRAHSGFNRDNIQDYINLYCFIQNPPKDNLDKVKVVLDSAIHNPNTLKYRELFSKSSDK